ncbi:hypothetical protein [Pseudomonas sp. NPDC089534]|uniref:hypothetical protein n=1 Tax=Pseudomonas sp. NPDC089534 TaxID=3364468 RepID=UPI003815451A
MSVKINFDNELAIASIPLADWAPPLVEHLARYFDVQEGILRLDYAHLSAEHSSVACDWLFMSLPDRENFTVNFEGAARQGAIALTLAILGHGSTGIQGSSSILDQNAYGGAKAAFSKDALEGNSRALRETIISAIAPRQIWVRWLLNAQSSDRSRFLEDQEIMAALLASTSEDDCFDVLELVAPGQSENNWAFEQLVEQYWPYICNYLETQADSAYNVPDVVFLLYAHSSKVQASRWACELVLNLADPKVFPRLIQHCSTIVANDVRNLFLRWHFHPDTKKKNEIKACVGIAYSTLARLIADAMPSDLALAAAWHEVGDPPRSGQQSVVLSLRELPSGGWGREGLWSQLGPAAREAWRQILFDQVRGEPELAEGLLYFTCLWLEQTAFGEVEPVLLRLMDEEDYLAFATRLANAEPRQLQLRAMGLIRSKHGALDLAGPADQSQDTTALPFVGAQTWIGDPSVERVIHRALSQIEEKFCREYSASWGEDEEAHTARLLTLTQEAASNASLQLRQLSATTRATYPTLSVKVRQPNKREEGTSTTAGAPLGADVLFLTRIVDEGKAVIQRATFVQVKKRSGTESGKSFSSTISIDLRQCEDMLTQSEHAYYLFATPAWPRPTLWVAPARLVRNLTQLHTSKTSVVATQVRDASCSYADFFLHYLVGLWAGDEQKDIVAVANGDPRLGRTPRHIVDIEVRRQPDG